MLQELYQYVYGILTLLYYHPKDKLLDCTASLQTAEMKSRAMKGPAWLSSSVNYGTITHTAAMGTSCLPDPFASISSAQWV